MPVLVKANESIAARRRVYFHLVGTDGITPANAEAGGQPQIASNGTGGFVDTGIGTLSLIGNGRYSADLTQAAVASAGTSIETRYKSASTAECPGDSVRVVADDPYAASGTGAGDTPIDHDGGDAVTVDGDASEADILRYVDGDGAGVDGLIVRAYLASDYSADPPIRTVLGVTSTGSDGRWAAPLMLSAGTYTIVADRTGDGFVPQVNEVVVP